MAQCVRDDLDCADLCDVTARHLARLNAGQAAHAVRARDLHRGLRAVRRQRRDACQALVDALEK